MRLSLRRLLAFFIPTSLIEDPDTHYRARIVVGLAMALIPWGPVFALLFWIQDGDLIKILRPLVGCSVGISALAVLSRTGKIRFAANLLIGSMIVSSALDIYDVGGLSSPILFIWPVQASVAVYLAGIYSGVIWTLFMEACLVVYATMLPVTPTLPGTPPAAAALTIALVAALVISILYERIRVALYAQVRDQQARLTDATKMAALGQLANGLAHEVNTPLAIVQTRAEQLVDLVRNTPIDAPTAQHLAGIIHSHSTRISKVVIALRDFTRDRAERSPESNPLHDLIQETLVLCDTWFAPGALKVEIAPGLKALCQRQETMRALLSLLSNARDAVHGQENPWIQLTALAQQGKAVIAVSNSGPPIPEAVRSKLFQPFFTTKDVGQGAGLGLSTALGIIKAQNGRAYFDAQAAQTRFVIELPLVP